MFFRFGIERLWQAFILRAADRVAKVEVVPQPFLVSIRLVSGLLSNSTERYDQERRHQATKFPESVERERKELLSGLWA